MTDSSMRMTWQLPDCTEYMIDSNKRKLFTEGSTQLKVLSK